LRPAWAKTLETYLEKKEKEGREEGRERGEKKGRE
jgi:hypothetical protein